METIIAALITGVVGLITAIIALTPKLNKILNSLNAQNTAAEHQHDKRSNEHRGLSGEHSGLSKEHDRLSIEHKELCSGITAATQDLRALREGQIRDEERQHLLVGKQLDIQRTVEHIEALNNEVLRLQSENQRLVQTQVLLEQKNADLRQQLTQATQRPPRTQERNQPPEHDDDWGMEQ